MMKKIFRVIACICLLFTFTIPANANELTPMYGHKLINGVSNVTVWLDPDSNVSYWETYINWGANKWMYTGYDNPIYITFVSSNYGSTIDFYRNSYTFFPGNDPLAYAAETKWFNSSGNEVNKYTTDWLYAEIHLNHDCLSSDTVSNFQARSILTHEYGHAFGLDHSPMQFSIMWGNYMSAGTDSVHQFDNASICYLYN